LYRQAQTDSLNVKARKQSIVSAESALEATETGYRVGTRNIVEVLNSQKVLYGAQRDYANARYDYIINMLNLKFYAGTLNESDLVTLNNLLQPEA
ncbi:MAG TPA: TolC family protein, partial [Pseudomonadales bacterium]|nr:TolC family protein [Pseudomonadales bacterium]